MNKEEKMHDKKNLAEYIKQLRPQSHTRKKIKESNHKNMIGAGGLILDISSNKILVVKGPEKWSLPKGHLDPGEEPHEAAMREIFEETSLQIDIQPTARSKKLRKYIYYYIILENAQQLQLSPLDYREVSEVKWCSDNELIELDCNKQLRYFIEKWKAILKVFYDDQKCLTLKGSCPNQEERDQFKLKIAQEHLLYNSLYSTPRRGVSRKDEDQDDDQLDSNESGSDDENK